MRRATITIPDELEALLERYLARLDAPPSLTTLAQAALRRYLEEASLSEGSRSEVAEDSHEYDDAPPAATLDRETSLALRRVAASKGMTVEQLARSVLEEYARSFARPEPVGIGSYRSGRSDVSSRAEELLREAAETSR